MGDPYNDDDPFRIMDRVQYPIPSLPDPILLLAGEFLRSLWPWVGSKRLDSFDDPAAIAFRECLDLLYCRRLDAQVIIFHAVACP